jgi:3D (Asp-Asp-Asp) domain-containing protein
VWADEDCTTASGEKAVEGITVAADTDILPLGTVIRINGQEYTVQDTGSAVKGNVIDVFYNDHQTAVQHGVQYLAVEVKR